MKKVVGALFAVVAASAVIVVSVASAEGTPRPLYEASGFGCGVLDRDGGFIFTTDSYLVWRQNGNVYLKCDGQGTPGSTIVTHRGFLCGLGPFGLTENSIDVVRRGGVSQLECFGHVDPGDAPDTASSGGYGAG